MELTDLGARALRSVIDRGEASCVEVVSAHLDRIERVDPGIGALVGHRRREDVLAEARERDAELRLGEFRGSLHGLPHAVKDLAEAAGLPWTAGSPLFAARVGAVDEPAVARIRAAGAVVVAKTNVPELGFGSQTYNPVWGTTRNPYDPTRTPGGSSGGAAAALAARLLPLADGSDYMGSLRNPAAFCNVLGLRPSRRSVPSAAPGFVAGLAEIGPMAREVSDLATLLEVMACPTPTSRAPLLRSRGAASSGSSATPRARCVRPTSPASVSHGPAISVAGWPANRACSVSAARRPGSSPRPGVTSSTFSTPCPRGPALDLERLWRAFLTWRAWATVPMRPLLADPVLRAELKPEAVWEIEQGLALSLEDVEEAMTVRADWYARVVDLLTRVDLVVAPSAQVFPFPADVAWPAEVAGRVMDTYHRWMETVVPWSMAGVPALGMPAGFDARGLPTGVQLIGPPGADARVLAAAAAYEQATRWVDRAPDLPA